jgi:hypothetical protein
VTLASSAWLRPKGWASISRVSRSRGAPFGDPSPSATSSLFPCSGRGNRREPTSVGSLRREELALAGHAPAVSAEGSISAQHSMARNQKRNRVRGAGTGDGAHSAGATEGGGDLGVGSDFAGRNGTEVAPHVEAQRSCPKIQRQRCAAPLAAQMVAQGSDPAREGPREGRADLVKRRPRELSAQPRLELRRRRTEADGAQAAVGRSDQEQMGESRRPDRRSGRSS